MLLRIEQVSKQVLEQVLDQHQIGTSKRAESDAMSLMSVESDSSGSTVHRCFLSDWLLRTRRGLLRFDELEIGDRVISAAGLELQIIDPPVIHDERLESIVKLCTEEQSVTVSPHHRVLTNLQPRQVERAKDLIPGRRVVVGDGSEIPLVDVQRKQEYCRLVEVHFHPDEPVEILQPTSIWTLGQRRRQQGRRSGMNRRQASAGNQEGCAGNLEQDGDDLVTNDSRMNVNSG